MIRRVSAVTPPSPAHMRVVTAWGTHSYGHPSALLCVIVLDTTGQLIYSHHAFKSSLRVLRTVHGMIPISERREPCPSRTSTAGGRTKPPRPSTPTLPGVHSPG